MVSREKAKGTLISSAGPWIYPHQLPGQGEVRFEAEPAQESGTQRGELKEAT